MCIRDSPPDVDVLKIDIPANATPQTPWQLARLEHAQYFVPLPPQRRRLEDEGRIGYMFNTRAIMDEQSDAALVQAGIVAVTPLTLDMTARVVPEVMQRLLSNGEGEQP